MTSCDLHVTSFMLPWAVHVAMVIMHQCYRCYCYGYNISFAEFTVQFDPASYTVDETAGVASITIVSNKQSPSANNGAALFYTESGTATGKRYSH